ncbi:MAG TPA: hypothetical protein VGB17_04175 [Pyrinomonadaceae bacterium]|jgi:hypothetical protein
MSYHILQQFDEQFLADVLRQDSGASAKQSKARRMENLARLDDCPDPDFPRKGLWLIVIASLLMAAFSLSLALDARRRADNLQQRYSTLEKMRK